MKLLESMKKSGDGWKGKAIHPYEQKAYSSKIEQISGNMVKLDACISGIICQSLFWHRAAK